MIAFKVKEILFNVEHFLCHLQINHKFWNVHRCCLLQRACMPYYSNSLAINQLGKKQNLSIQWQYAEQSVQSWTFLRHICCCHPVQSTRGFQQIEEIVGCPEINEFLSFKLSNGGITVFIITTIDVFFFAALFTVFVSQLPFFVNTVRTTVG